MRSSHGHIPDPARGAALFAAHCAQCHSVGHGEPHKWGPNLNGVIGRKAGSLEDYPYSPAHKTAEVIWTPCSLSDYLRNPSVYIPGTKKHFKGMMLEQHRQDVIAYLREASSGSSSKSGSISH